MDFLSKKKSYFFDFDEKEGKFLNKIFLYMDETPVKETNLKSFVDFIKTDKNIIKSTEKKLNKFIEKYNFSKIVESFIDIFTKGFTESAQKESAHKYSLQPLKKKKQKIFQEVFREAAPLQPLKKKEKYQVYKGGSEAEIKELGSTFGFLIFLAIILKVLIYMSENSTDFHDMYRIFFKDIVDYSFEKLMFLYYRFRYLILKERIDIETLEIIALPGIEKGIESKELNDNDLFRWAESAEPIPENKERQLRQNHNSLLEQYNRSKDYRIYSRLTQREQNLLLEQINRIENELASLLQPPVVVEKLKIIYSGDARSLLDMYYDDSNDIAAHPVPATDETKNIFKFILRYCLGFINRIPYDDDEYNDDDDVVVGQTNRIAFRNRIPQIVDQRPNINRILDDDEYNDDNVVVDGQSNRVDIRNIIPHGNQIVNQSRLHDIHNYQYQNENEIQPSAPPLPYWEDERSSVLQRVTPPPPPPPVLPRVPTTSIVIPSAPPLPYWEDERSSVLQRVTPPPPPVLPTTPIVRSSTPPSTYKYAKGGRSRRRRRRSEKGSRRRGRGGGTGRRKKKRSNTCKIKS
jgi:hypothetical protein